MDATIAWLDEQIKASTEEGDMHMQMAFRCQGVIRMAEHVKARLAQPEPEPDECEPDVLEAIPVPSDDET